MAKPIRHRNKWRVRWFDQRGQRRSQVFARYVDAERALRKYQVEADAIKAGLVKPPLAQHTFSELCDYWIIHRAANKRSGKDDISIIRRHFRPFFGSAPLLETTSEHTDRFKLELGTRVSPKTVHNVLTLLISMFNMAVEIGWIERAPVIKKPKIHEQDYSYLKSDREIRLLLNTAKEKPLGTYEFYATAIYTGMRAGEICGLHWDDVDFDNRLITVQRSYKGPTKSGYIRRVPILDPLLPILRSWRLRCPLPIVFPNCVGNIHSPSARVLQETFHKCLQRAGLTRIRFHDLRHTFASHWMMKGGDIYRLQKILGHRSIKMTERYSHLSPEAFTDDLGRLGESTTKAQTITMLGS